MNSKDNLIEEFNEIEKEIIPFLAQGLSAKEIAPLIHMSYHTVKRYISIIIKKTNARNRVNAVAILARKHYV
ncbi:MAG: helix-turn-helix transcriptional regulator [Brachyspira sp.]|nr:helix-turn-helix transcriptional regulator [Brachyspira sp.]